MPSIISSHVALRFVLQINGDENCSGGGVIALGTPQAYYRNVDGEYVGDRQVSKLCPKKPILAGTSASILSVVQMLATRRGDAALIVNVNGGLAGIITDHDVTHCVVAKLSPTLCTVLAGKTSNIVSPDSSLQAVGMMMAEARKAAMIVDRDKLVGIFGFKDMMTQAIAKEILLDSTPVSAVMTLNLEFVSPETTVLEALQIMDDNKFLTLPVCEIDGRVGGLVDVMDCVHASGGAEG